MNDQDTWIEQPANQPQGQNPDLPPLPPPPPPPGSGGGRKWLLIGGLLGLVILALCVVAGYVGWRFYQGDPIALFGEAEATDPAPGQTQTALAEAVTAIVLASETPAPTETEPLPTLSLPTDTPAPVEAPTDTLVPSPAVPVFTASQALFCRLGPSSIYQELRTMNAGDSQPILGRSTSPVDGTSTWWQVEIDGRRCFVSADLGTVAGDPSSVPFVNPPPTPTPTPTATPTFTPTPTATP